MARDFLDECRPRHHLALKLFALARRGDVELVSTPQGYRLDVQGDLAEQLRAVFRDEGVLEARQLAYPSEATFPGPDLLPGAFVPGLREAWDDVVAGWKSHEGKPPGPEDRVHVETHLLEKRDVFVTDDGPLLAMCRRAPGGPRFRDRSDGPQGLPRAERQRRVAAESRAIGAAGCGGVEELPDPPCR